ncbi:MAG: hypothetical protein AAGD11_15335 [Planctomycetota bacterium]
MYPQTMSRLAHLTRIIAVVTSGAAALLFAAALATEPQLDYQLGQYLAGRETNPVLPGLLAILAVTFLGYLAATRTKSARTGGLVALGGVLALYAWCQFSFDLTLSPVVLTIAAPAVFHLLSDKLRRASLQSETDLAGEPSADEAAEMPTSEAQIESQPEGELVAGAA